MDTVTLREITTQFTAMNYNQEFEEPFNQCTFFNYDTSASVSINKLKIPPAILIGSNVYPTSFTVSLNENEVNTTNYSVDFGSSTNANLQIVYTQYLGIGL